MYSKYLYSLTTDYNNMLAGVLKLVNTWKTESEEWEYMIKTFCLWILLANDYD
jgi:hypothetical protein